MDKRYGRVLEIATERIREYKRREAVYKCIILVLALILIVVCIGIIASGDDVCAYCEETKKDNKTAEAGTMAATEPQANLLLRERTMKRGVY